MSVVRTMLSGHDLFRLFGAEEIEQVSRISSAKRFATGETIHDHNTVVSHVFLCLEGSVQLQLPEHPAIHSLVIARVGKGQLFGVASLLGIERYTTTARAASPVEVLALEARPFQRIVDGNPIVAQQLMQRVAQVYLGRYRDASSRSVAGETRAALDVSSLMEQCRYMDVGIRELKQRLSEYLERVARGERIRVTDRGRPKALIIPLVETEIVERGVREGWIVPGEAAPPRPVQRARARRRVLELLAEDRDDGR
jgi:prevent-host-death family protein